MAKIDIAWEKNAYLALVVLLLIGAYLFRYSWLSLIFTLAAIYPIVLWFQAEKRKWETKLEGDPARAKEELGLEGCPQCGSGNLSLWLGGSAGIIYQCKNCGYKGNVDLKTGDVSEEMKRDLEGFRQELVEG